MKGREKRDKKGKGKRERESERECAMVIKRQQPNKTMLIKTNIVIRLNYCSSHEITEARFDQHVGERMV